MFTCGGWDTGTPLKFSHLHDCAREVRVQVSKRGIQKERRGHGGRGWKDNEGERVRAGQLWGLQSSLTLSSYLQTQWSVPLVISQAYSAFLALQQRALWSQNSTKSLLIASLGRRKDCAMMPLLSQSQRKYVCSGSGGDRLSQIIRESKCLMYWFFDTSLFRSATGMALGLGLMVGPLLWSRMKYLNKYWFEFGKDIHGAQRVNPNYILTCPGKYRNHYWLDCRAVRLWQKS